ncbi:unnamed protein product [Rotaria sordida]|uniref:Poly(A) RNA polymerase, mitochondrial n=1 Tax=Rotaria sordida TaxID=392033 RepID=A0A814DQ68_9BILA|nr:unnamed protein product [Rotaria sordida]CAF1041090.1 unnamed protein product [Rotaria sordida]
MLPLIPMYRSLSFSRSFMLTGWHYAFSIQHYSSSIRPPTPPYSGPSMKKSGAIIQTFDAMIDFRRQQARRTVLIHLGRSHSESELYKLCSRVGQITNMTLYTANKKECALLEFSTEQSVKNLLEITSHFINENRLPCASRNLYFASQYTGARLKYPPVGREVQQLDDTFIDKALNDIRNVSDQIRYFWQKTKLTELDTRLRFFVASLVEEGLRSIFVDTVCLPFGSSVNTFGKTRCDLDMLLSFEDFRDKNIKYDGKMQQLRFLTKRSYLNDRFQAQAYLKILADTLKHFMAECTNVQIILPARVPIVRFQHRLSDLQCDVSMSEFKSSYYMSKLLWSLSSIDSRVAPLVFVIRRWAREASITQSTPGPWFSNYQMTLLVLFYLQSIEILPKLNYINEQFATASSSSSPDVTSANGDLSDNLILMNELENIRRFHPNKSNNDSLAILFKGFFSFYENFDFQSSVITLLERQNTSKSSLIQAGKDKEWPIYLENPLVPSMNASKNLVESEGERFRQTCSKASQILSQSSKNLLSLFEECRQSLPDDLVARAYPAPISIMPNLETDIDQEELSTIRDMQQEQVEQIFDHTDHHVINS